MEAAYRTIPVWPPHKRFLVVGMNGQFWIDHVFPFGLTTAGGVQGHVADATVDILACLKVSPVKKWVDDHLIFRIATSGGLNLPDGSMSPFKYPYSLNDIINLTAPLGVPWHTTKRQDFTFNVLYLGFLWDIPHKSVTLPDAKQQKYLAKIAGLLARLSSAQRISFTEAMSINGTLSHITFVIPHGRSYLSGISQFIAQYPSRFASRFPPPSVINDLKWWFNVLSHPPTPRSLSPRGPPVDLDLWVDASTDWGIGICIGQRWDAWRTIAGWKGNGRDIGWLEAVAVELAVRSLHSVGWKNAHIIIHSDNQGVIGAFTHGRSRNFQVNLVIRRVEQIAMSSNVLHTLTFTPSAGNKADPVSRGEVGSLESRLSSFQLPVELHTFLAPHVVN